MMIIKFKFKLIRLKYKIILILIIFTPTFDTAVPKIKKKIQKMIKAIESQC